MPKYKNTSKPQETISFGSSLSSNREYEALTTYEDYVNVEAEQLSKNLSKNEYDANQRELYKDTPCRFFRSTYGCKRGDDCWYMHARWYMNDSFPPTPTFCRPSSDCRAPSPASSASPFEVNEEVQAATLLIEEQKATDSDKPLEESTEKPLEESTEKPLETADTKVKIDDLMLAFGDLMKQKAFGDLMQKFQELQKMEDEKKSNEEMKEKTNEKPSFAAIVGEQQKEQKALPKPLDKTPAFPTDSPVSTMTNFGNAWLPAKDDNKKVFSVMIDELDYYTEYKYLQDLAMKHSGNGGCITLVKILPTTRNDYLRRAFVHFSQERNAEIFIDYINTNSSGKAKANMQNWGITADATDNSTISFPKQILKPEPKVDKDGYTLVKDTKPWSSPRQSQKEKLWNPFDLLEPNPDSDDEDDDAGLVLESNDERKDPFKTFELKTPWADSVDED